MELGSYPAHRKSGVVNLHLRSRAPVPYPTMGGRTCEPSPALVVLWVMSHNLTAREHPLGRPGPVQPGWDLRPRAACGHVSQTVWPRMQRAG